VKETEKETVKVEHGPLAAAFSRASVAVVTHTHTPGRLIHTKRDTKTHTYGHTHAQVAACACAAHPAHLPHSPRVPHCRIAQYGVRCAITDEAAHLEPHGHFQGVGVALCPCGASPRLTRGAT